MNRTFASKSLAALLSVAALAGVVRPASAQMVNAQTGTTYTMLNTDCDPQGRKIVTFSNAAGVAVTLPQAGGSGNFLGGCAINAVNIGLGPVTITPTTSTINNAALLVVPSGASVAINNDSTGAATGNYWASLGGSGAAGSTAFASPRNFVENGGMAVQQRGTGERTGAQNAGLTTAAYSADRWGISANVASGAAFGAAVTTSLPTGFSGAQTVYRKTGALLQPVCLMHEIPTVNSTELAGQTVTLSFYAKALAGMIADNGGVMNAYIITGTGSDEGFGTMTASPAITPAWTGISSTLTTAVTLTTGYVRYSYTAALPSTETELGVLFCFTPTASGAGVTDGFAVTGVQLERGTIASPFEFRPFAQDFATAQRYYWQIADGAATVPYPSSCFVTAANTTVKCGVTLPVVMRAVPTTTVGTAQSFGIVVTAGTAGTCTTLAATSASNTTQSIGVTCTTGGTIALGSATPLIGAATGGILSASADF